MNIQDDRYTRQHAAHRVDGYYTPPRSREHVPAQFERAKAELLSHLRADIAFVEAMTCEQFLAWRK